MAWSEIVDAASRWKPPSPRAMLCLIFIALLTSPVAPSPQSPILRARGASARPQQSSKGGAATRADPARGGWEPPPATIVPEETRPRLSLRGGGDIHNAEVDLGHGNKVENEKRLSFTHKNRHHLGSEETVLQDMMYA